VKVEQRKSLRKKRNELVAVLTERDKEGRLPAKEGGENLMLPEGKG